jgi:hypothetical protein
MLFAPIHHHLNQTGQNTLTDVSWALTAILAAVAVYLGRKEGRTPFYLLIVLAAMVAACAEPLYDEAFSLYFYSTPHTQTTFTAFNIPQPVWAYSGYAVLYAAPAIYICHKIRNDGLDRRGLLGVAGVILLMSCVFEIAGINMGTYTYWGPHVLRIFKYPIVIGILETAQVTCFAIACAQLRDRATSTAQFLAVFAIFPVTFFGANFGAGAAVIIGIHVKHTTQLLVTICTLLSIGCAVTLIRLASSFLPASPKLTPEAERAPVGGGLVGRLTSV